ncbi:RNA polymerase sigma factor [Roseivirga sp. BDSF3-8]|uniref:RNA polymerase sigma factor n=1 Tax=Roseivirga sp. BDSF3-8 TaxID=3241598 RepID=UPI003531B377
MATTVPDSALVQRAKEGDQQAFGDLVDRYKDPSLSLAVSILKDTALAQDVLQDAFMRVYHSIGGFREEAAFSSWLYRIVVNTSYNALKSARYLKKTETLQPGQVYGSTQPKPMKEEDQQKYVQLALDRLSADEALVLRLFYLHELQIPEIAHITRFGKPKIKVCLHRGRKNMMKKLEQLVGKEVKDLL